MLRTISLVGGGLLACAALLSLAGCSTSSPTASPDPARAASPGSDTEHGHKVGPHGGTIVSLGHDLYHVESVVTSTGELRLYTLGSDESRVVDIEIQELVAYVKPVDGSDFTSTQLEPRPQPGDAQGKASLFVAQLPESLVGRSFDISVPNIAIEGKSFRLSFTSQAEEHGAEVMPEKVADEGERKLYLTPGGLYTQADIEANGNVTASQKFVGFQATHDLKPKVGDKICPVTLTKANPKCAWIVGGKNYEFCCPPCVDEFVGLAKTKPEEVKQPDEYVQREATASELK